MTIQSAHPTDRPALEALLQSAGLPVSDLPGDLQDFMLARENGRVLGSAGLEVLGAYGLLRSVAVDEAARNRGLGEQLLRAAEQTASKRRVTAIYLITDSADRYFEKHGFQRVERSEAPAEIRQTAQFQGLCPASSILMAKPLS